MMCGDPLFLPARLSLLSSARLALTAEVLRLVRVFSQGPQPAADSFAVAVSGTFTLEVL